MYALTNEAEVEEKEDFYEQLQREIEERPQYDLILIPEGQQDYMCNRSVHGMQANIQMSIEVEKAFKNLKSGNRWHHTWNV